MTLVDSNVLLYASDEDDARHEASLDLVERCRCGDAPGAVTGGILAEFVAGLTWPRRPVPLSSAAAQAAVVRLMAGRLSLLPTTTESVLLFARLVSHHGLRGQDVHDAQHAALGITGGCDVVATFDEDHWRRFVDEGLAILVPRR